MIPEITQQNVRIFIPYKAANICDEISKTEHISITEAVAKFYKTKTARMLSVESTKLWHLGWVGLYDMYKEETNEQ